MLAKLRTEKIERHNQTFLRFLQMKYQEKEIEQMM